MLSSCFDKACFSCLLSTSSGLLELHPHWLSQGWLEEKAPVPAHAVPSRSLTAF